MLRLLAPDSPKEKTRGKGVGHFRRLATPEGEMWHALPPHLGLNLAKNVLQVSFPLQTTLGPDRGELSWERGLSPRKIFAVIRRHFLVFP